MPLDRDILLNDFAIRCFRDIADGDYITARLSFRASLTTQFLWSSQQAIEKYLKAILLFQRIKATKIFHHLDAAISALQQSGKVAVSLSPQTEEFIKRVDTYGRFRYLESSPYVFGTDLKSLDQAIWEIRRYCTLSQSIWNIPLTQPPTIVHIQGGYLESIISKAGHPAREPLLWRNGFFGVRRRARVKVNGGFVCINSPLVLNPQILEEVSKFVFLPKEVMNAYASAAAAHASTPP